MIIPRFIARPRTGKTHLATAICVQAVEHHRKKARFFATIELLEQKKAQGKVVQMADSLLKLDMVILDELDYLPFSLTGGALLFDLLSKLYERTSVAVLPNMKVGKPDFNSTGNGAAYAAIE